MKSLLIVGLGSFVGGSVRYIVSLLLAPSSARFPVGTLVVNLAGCLLIGLLYGLFSRHTALPRDLMLLLTTGLCGGFTTFSTFANESLLLLQSHNYWAFAAYVLLSVIFGLLAVLLGYHLANS